MINSLSVGPLQTEAQKREDDDSLKTSSIFGGTQSQVGFDTEPHNRRESSMFEPNKNVFITHDIKERGRMNSNKVRKSEVLANTEPGPL